MVEALRRTVTNELPSHLLEDSSWPRIARLRMFFLAFSDLRLLQMFASHPKQTESVPRSALRASEI